MAGGFAVAAGGTSGTTSDGTLAAARATAGRLPGVGFHGVHQAGIAPDPFPGIPRQASVIALDVTAPGRAGLMTLLRVLTERARFLAAGGTPAVVPDPEFPADDTGILGPVIAPDGLTVTAGAGASLFDDRFGLAAGKPAGLSVMTAFPNDALEADQCGGDLVVLLSAGSADTVQHALRDILRSTVSLARPRWLIDGFASTPRPAGTVPRNLLGFMDGISNPGPDVAWLPDGGSYLVIRLIRMHTERWDNLQLAEQEHIIGRERASGYPVGQHGIDASPDYGRDPLGVIIPLTAHIRLANPRTQATAGSRVLRRSFNYDRGLDADGTLDSGLIFLCYQRDIAAQFETVQRRLIDEPLSGFITPFGGGYFYAFPGVRDSSDYYGSTLINTSQH